MSSTSNVFITGSTGTIGSALVPLFLNDSETRIHLLIRARSQSHLRERVESLFRFWEISPEPALSSGRLTPYQGDVCLARFGLDDGTYARLSKEITHVIHAAGNVKLNQSLAEALRNTLDSAKAVVSFCKACRQEKFKKLDFVSTIGVAGRMEGVVPETFIEQPRQFRNTYEEAKAAAENFLAAEMKAGFPATIHRPSMVVGDSKSGKVIQFQVFYHLSEFLSGRNTRGIVPGGSRFRLDIIPSDAVARFMRGASLRDDAVGKIFHLCSGPEKTLSLPDLERRIQSIFYRADGRAVPLKTVNYRWIRALLPLASLFASGGAKRGLRTLPYFLDYLDGKQTFDNQMTSVFFAKEGFKVPRVDEYLETILNYYLKHGRKANADTSG